MAGVARNARLHKIVADREAEREVTYPQTHSKQRLLREFRYAADSWKTERRLVTRLEFGNPGRNHSCHITQNGRLSHPQQAAHPYSVSHHPEPETFLIASRALAP